MKSYMKSVERFLSYNQRKEANELSDNLLEFYKHDLFVFVAMLLNQQIDRHHRTYRNS